MANSDQMLHFVASDLGVHCFLRPVRPNTCVVKLIHGETMMGSIQFTVFPCLEYCVIMPPTLKKLEGHITSGVFVLPFVLPFVTLFDA